MSEKIRPTHLERAAFVYVRQSTPGQVRHHVEGRRRQYALVERAQQLGFARTEVIDEDLGRSGAGSQERPGFARLLAAVCQGAVGAVVAAEASRLARNNRDWHHLIDLCALADALVIDYDGIYDPRMLNDRLLLGLKGTMSEFELSLLHQRAEQARRQLIERGAVMHEVGVGYVRTEDGRCEKTADRQVQAAVEGLFAKFRELGSARQLHLWYCREEILAPMRVSASRGNQIVWRRPTFAWVLGVLKNPSYTGAYVWGRRRRKPTTVVQGRVRGGYCAPVPLSEWAVLIHDHHAQYISWDEYLRNQQILTNNAGLWANVKQGAPKTGLALVGGLLRCGRCGRKLHVVYPGPSRGYRVPRYRCWGAQARDGERRCLVLGSARIDAAVERELLAAIAPGAVEAAEQAERQWEATEDEKRRQLALAMERARYEVKRARTQYDAVDPENRLVAAELEARWNEALRGLGVLEARLAEASTKAAPLGDAERQRLQELGRDVDALWHHAAAPPGLKKRILRTVLEEIVAEVTDQPAELVLRLHWVGGVHTEVRMRRTAHGEHRRCTDRKIIDIVRELAKVCDDAKIAAALNQQRLQTGAGNSWTAMRVRSLRSYHEVPCWNPVCAAQWVTSIQAAELLGISECTVRRLLAKQILPGAQPVRGTPWVICRDDLDRPEVREAVGAIRNRRRIPSSGPNQSLLPFISDK